MAPDVLIHADHAHAVEPVRVVDQHPLALGQDRVVGGVPRDPESLGDTGDGQMLDHDGFQRPPQPAARQLRPRLGRLGRVLAPHIPAAGAPVATDRDDERRRSPAERLVRQPSRHRVTRGALTAAAPAPWVRLDDPARQHSAIGLQPLPNRFKAQARRVGRTWSGQGRRSLHQR